MWPWASAASVGSGCLSVPLRSGLAHSTPARDLACMPYPLGDLLCCALLLCAAQGGRGEEQVAATLAAGQLRALGRDHHAGSRIPTCSLRAKNPVSRVTSRAAQSRCVHACVVVPICGWCPFVCASASPCVRVCVSCRSMCHGRAWAAWPMPQRVVSIVPGAVLGAIRVRCLCETSCAQLAANEPRRAGRAGALAGSVYALV